MLPQNNIEDENHSVPVVGEKMKWLSWGALIVIGGIFIRNMLAYDYLSDDAFITMRYARNFAQGLGLVFNPGERVEGFTSFLWTIILAVPRLFNQDMVW